MQVYYLQENITNIVADYVDADGKKRTVALGDICFKPLLPDNGNCTIQSVLNYFQNDYVKLVNATHDPFGGTTYNASYHIHDCTRLVCVSGCLTRCVCVCLCVYILSVYVSVYIYV